MWKNSTERIPHFLELMMDTVRSSRSTDTLAVSEDSAPSTFMNSSRANSCSMQDTFCSFSALTYKICTRNVPRSRMRSVMISVSSICTSPRLSTIFSTSGLVSGTFISSSMVICTFFSIFKRPDCTAFFSIFILPSTSLSLNILDFSSLYLIYAYFFCL